MTTVGHSLLSNYSILKAATDNMQMNVQGGCITINLYLHRQKLDLILGPQFADLWSTRFQSNTGIAIDR